MKDKRLIEAFNVWEELRSNPDTIIVYHSRLKVIIDEEAKLDYAEHKGIKKGIEQGIKIIAEKMIAKGKSNEEIMEMRLKEIKKSCARMTGAAFTISLELNHKRFLGLFRLHVIF